jgi:hypothetical protein
MKTKPRICFGSKNALTDVDQDACSFENLVIDSLHRYVGIHVLLNEVLGKDNWERGSLREHDAWELRRCSERERAGREAPNRKE